MTTTDTMTAEQHEAKAADLRAEAAASFERCDTDGFATQAANGIMARLHEARAQIARDGGTAEFRALFDLDGNVVSTHEGYGQYGRYYVLQDEPAERFGRRFVSPSNAENIERRRKNNRAKGFTEGTIRAAAHADTWAPEGARGFSGLASVSIVVKPDVAALRRGDYVVVCTES